jgi:hypothetical protein
VGGVVVVVVEGGLVVVVVPPPPDDEAFTMGVAPGDVASALATYHVPPANDLPSPVDPRAPLSPLKV